MLQLPPRPAICPPPGLLTPDEARRAMPLIYTSFQGGGGAPPEPPPSGPFSPADLFASGEIGVWIDPSDDATCFQDVAMETPAGNGDPVRVILDKSGNAKHLTASSDAERPTRVEAGGVWYLDATTHSLDAIAFSSTLAQPLYYCFGFKVPGSVAQADVLFGSVTGGRVEFQHVNGRWAMNAGATAGTLINFELSDTDPHVGFSIFDASDPYLAIDGVEQTVSSGALGTDGLSRLRLFDYSGGNRPWAGRLYGLVMSNTSFVSHQADIEQWMAAKTGIAF